MSPKSTALTFHTLIIYYSYFLQLDTDKHLNKAANLCTKEPFYEDQNILSSSILLQGKNGNAT